MGPRDRCAPNLPVWQSRRRTKKAPPLGRRIGLSGVSGCRAGDVRWRDEKIEIALSRSSFSSQGNRLRCALGLPLSVELTRHQGTALRARVTVTYVPLSQTTRSTVHRMARNHRNHPKSVLGFLKDSHCCRLSASTSTSLTKPFKRLRRVLKRQRTILGRLLRDIERKLFAAPDELQAQPRVWLERA